MPTKFKRWMCLLVMMGFASQSTANAQMPSAGSPGEVTAVPQAAVIPKAKKFAATGQGVGISQTNAACLTPADLSSSCAVGPCFA
jgi:hypothetical protein